MRGVRSSRSFSYLRDRLLGDVSPLTCRSYAYYLLRWFRVLWTLDVSWEQATEAEAAARVGWLRSARNPQRHRRREGGYPPGAVNPKTGKRVLAAGYAPATIAHSLSAVLGFYAFHLHFGRGPVLNPVPENWARRATLAHRSPLEAPARHRRGRLRPKVSVRQPRAIPDAQWEELFARMRCARDQAPLACYVSSGPGPPSRWASGSPMSTGRRAGCGSFPRAPGTVSQCRSLQRL